MLLLIISAFQHGLEKQLWLLVFAIVLRVGLIDGDLAGRPRASEQKMLRIVETELVHFAASTSAGTLARRRIHRRTAAATSLIERDLRFSVPGIPVLGRSISRFEVVVSIGNVIALSARVQQVARRKVPLRRTHTLRVRAVVV